jgi:hypothetical protein
MILLADIFVVYELTIHYFEKNSLTIVISLFYLIIFKYF